MEPTLGTAVEGLRSEPAPSASQRAMQALSRMGDSDLREIVDLLQSICGVESAAISILEGDVYHLLITAGVEPLTCDADESLCTHTMVRHDVFVVEDARADERFAGSPYVDGRLRDIRFYASAPIYGPDHTMVGRLCLFDSSPRSLSPLQERTLTTLATNITQVIELRLLHEAEDEAGAEQPVTSDDAIRVAAQISHDMRIPLSALTTSLEMLRESAPVEPGSEGAVQARLYATARRSTDRISHMIEGLLQLNDAGRDLVLRDVDLTSLVRQVASDLGTQLREAGAELQLGPLPVVRADADQLYSVLLNLVTNAVKFARPGVPPVIRVESHRIGDGWRISRRRQRHRHPRGPAGRRLLDVLAARHRRRGQRHRARHGPPRRRDPRRSCRRRRGDDQGVGLWFELPDPVE